jgi:hypothetical protein
MLLELWGQVDAGECSPLPGLYGGGTNFGPRFSGTFMTGTGSNGGVQSKPKGCINILLSAIVIVTAVTV